MEVDVPESAEQKIFTNLKTLLTKSKKVQIWYLIAEILIEPDTKVISKIDLREVDTIFTPVHRRQ